MNRWLRIAVLIGVAAVAAGGWLSREQPRAGAAGLPEVAADVVALPSAIESAGLPAEVEQTLRLIRAGGPFPYDRDGTVFQNRERRLPDRPRGYYREYTVPTPGSRDRGARRIVTGGDPPETFYYTDDHYRTFQRLEAGSP